MADQDETVNSDPLSGAPGAHPVGVGVGAAGGAAAGAAIGAAGGPVGVAVGAAVGAVAGGLAGKGVAEVINPTAEDQHWAAHYSGTSYVKAGADYKTYQTAYRYGWESSQRHPGRSFDAVEPELKRMWDKYRHASSQTWEEAKAATRDAWHRVERAAPGDADGDGR
jgi:hypothetical protein